MKISYRTHPVLEKLHTGKLGRLICLPHDEFNLMQLRDSINTVWLMSCDIFNKNVQLISKPFGDAIHSSMKKMTSGDLVSEALHRNTSGTLLWGNHTFCYSFDFIDNKSHVTYFHFIKNQSDEIALNAFYIFTSDENARGSAKTYFAKSGLMDNDIKKTFKYHNANLITTVNFIKYADVEIKHLPALGKSKDILCKYINDTKISVNILDSKWFTTLVKSDAFKVRGHFRLQPKKKDGEWTKELIWINDFEKHGYTAPARKLKEAV